MQKYRVKSLSVSGRAPRKIYYYDECVTQECFVASVDELEKQGFIEKVADDYKTPSGFEVPVDPFSTNVKVDVQVDQQPEDQPEPKSEEGGEKLPVETDEEKILREESEKKKAEENQKAEDDLKRNEIMAELDKMKVVFDRNSSKAELFELLKEVKNKNPEKK